MDAVKTCKQCGQTKPLTEYRKTNRTRRGGSVEYSTRCFSCLRDYHAKRQQRLRDMQRSLTGSLNSWERMSFEEAMKAVDAVLAAWQPRLGVELAQYLGNSRTMLAVAIHLVNQLKQEKENERCNRKPERKTEAIPGGSKFRRSFPATDQSSIAGGIRADTGVDFHRGDCGVDQHRREREEHVQGCEPSIAI